jgi:hypothetical protein
MSLQGVLADFPVADVFQLISQPRKTGVLEVERHGRKLEILFLEGQVLCARAAETRPDGALAGFLLRTGALSDSTLAEARKRQDETLEALAPTLLQMNLVSRADLEQVTKLATTDTIFELFLWDEGRFAFRAESITPGPCDKPVAAEMVLLDALRMRDEWVTIQNGLPDLAVVVVPAVELEAFRQKRAAIEAESGVSGADLEKLFTFANGRIAARRVIDLSRLGTFQGARGLLALMRGGVLRAEQRDVGSEPDSDRGASRPPLIACAVLVACAVLAFGLSVARPSQQTLPTFGGDPIEELREEAATDRLRAALEVHRWASGSYPESLEELAPEQVLLAAVPLDRYSYARSSEGGFTLWRVRP